MIGYVLLNVGICPRHRIHRHDRLETAEDRLGSGVEYSAIGRRARHDNGVDAVISQYFLEVRFEKFLWSALHDRLVADRGDIRHRIAHDIAIDNAVDDENILCTRRAQQLLGRGHTRHTARPRLFVAALLDEIQHQKRRGLGVNRYGFWLRRRRRLHAWPFVDNGLRRRWSGRDQDDDAGSDDARSKQAEAAHVMTPVIRLEGALLAD